jgi:HNH endonuclease
MPNAKYRLEDAPANPQPGEIVRLICHHNVCRSKTHLYGWVTCPLCSEGRWLWIQAWHRSKLRETGPVWVCNHCRQRGRWGVEGQPTSVTGGYIRVAIWEDDPMFEMTAPDLRHRGRGFVLEHRLVMARRLGRTLRPGEQVHHVNGNRADNRIENLELWVGKNQPTGVRLGDYHCPGCRCNEIGNF